MLLKDKTVIVTGGTKGIGRAIVLKAASEGANVIIGGRDASAGAQLEAEISRSGVGNGVFVAADLTRPENCERLAYAAISHFGKLDGLVNYAGSVLNNATIAQTTEGEFDRVMEINFKSTFFMTQAAVKHMGDRGGSVVFMGSLHAYGGEIDRAAYACSKGADYALFRHMARNYPAQKIRSNWVTIGWVATPNEQMFRASMGASPTWTEEAGAAIMPMGRLQQDSDYTDAVIYLLSDNSSQTTGSELQISGGLRI